MRIFSLFIFLFLVPFSNSQASEKREYVISNMHSLLRSFSAVDFTQSSKEEVDKIKYHCAIKMNEFNRKQSGDLEKMFQQFEEHKISEDKFLRKLLDIRFRNINFFQKHQGFKLKANNALSNQFEGIGNLTIIAGNIQMPTLNLVGSYVKSVKGSAQEGLRLSFIDQKEREIQKIFDKLLPEIERTSEAEVRDSFTTLANDNLYVLTRLILAVYSLKSPKYFSEDTLDYIRASKSLWPFLSKVSSGADPFLVDDELSLFDNKSLLEEYELYAICLLNIYGKTERLYGLGCNETDVTTVFGPLKECDQIEGTWTLPSLPDSFYKEKVRRKKRQKQTLRRARARLQRTLIKSSETFIPAAAAAASEIGDQNSIRNELLLFTDNEKDQDDDKEEDNEVSPFQSDDESAFATSTSPIISAASASSRTSESHVFSRWNRSLHSERLQEELGVGDQSLGRQLKTLQKIFNGSKKVSYQKFESLWFHINGVKSIKKRSKSSHRALLNGEGYVVGGTFVLNGGRHQYSPHQLQELQDALTLVGYGQSYLDKLAQIEALRKVKEYD